MTWIMIHLLIYYSPKVLSKMTVHCWQWHQYCGSLCGFSSALVPAVVPKMPKVNWGWIRRRREDRDVRWVRDTAVGRHVPLFGLCFVFSVGKQEETFLLSFFLFVNLRLYYGHTLGCSNLGNTILSSFSQTDNSKWSTLFHWAIVQRRDW